MTPPLLNAKKKKLTEELKFVQKDEVATAYNDLL